MEFVKNYYINYLTIKILIKIIKDNKFEYIKSYLFNLYG